VVVARIQNCLFRISIHLHIDKNHSKTKIKIL
jgi:hypothetical protein